MWGRVPLTSFLFRLPYMGVLQIITVVMLALLSFPGRLSLLPLWDGKLSTSQRAVMLCGWEGNRRPGGKQWQPTAEWMS